MTAPSVFSDIAWALLALLAPVFVFWAVLKLLILLVEAR